MSNPGQAALGIVGGVVGFFVGGPQGAAWGFQLGMGAGSALFPTDLGTVSGPRLNDLNVQTSTVGAPIPIVYGTYAISGNVIWSSGIIETVSRKKQGGKGGPTQTVKTYSYKVNAAVGICEGEIGGIRRIWADAKLIYDARDQLTDETAEEYTARQESNAAFLSRTEIYLGSEDQLADPTIESIEGAGNVSGFRGLAYVVFSEFQLEDYGNRIPNFRFEVSSAANGCVPTVEYSNEVLYPWLGGNSPINSLNTNTVTIRSTGTGTLPGEFSSVAAAVSAAEVARGKLFGSYISYSLTTASNGLEDTLLMGGPDAPTQDPIEVNLHYNLQQPDLHEVNVPSLICQMVINSGGDVGSVIHSRGYYAGTAGFALYALGEYGSSMIPGYDTVTGCSSPPVAISVRADVIVTVDRSPGAPEGDGWQLTAGAFKALQRYTIGGSPPMAAKYPLNPVLPSSHADYNNQTFWEAAYDQAVIDGEMVGGLVYGVDYPVTETSAYVRTVETCVTPAGQITLGQIVEDVCLRCGLAADQIDVGDLTEMVDGYVLTRPMIGRDAIGPLRSYGWFDCVESEGVLKWPTRGKAGVFDFTADDLAAHPSGESRPSSVETERQQEVELPRRLRVHYAQTAQNYEPGEQGASRLAAGNVEVRDLEVAVAMSDTKGAQIAEVVLYDLWFARNRHRAIVDHSWLELEPSDAGTMPIDGRQERVRITNVDHSLPGLLRLELVRDDDGVYESYAVGAPAAYAGTGGGSISVPGDGVLVLLDIPLLADDHNDPGYYGAVYGEGGTAWSGGVIYRSSDGGVNYAEAGVATLEATVGDVDLALPAGPTTIIDEFNTLTVTLQKGELESITEASLFSGFNLAAIGDEGRWELIQFRDATLVSGTTWSLTGLTRGRRGTEWAVGSSLAGDTFVLLDGALVRMSLGMAGIGVLLPHKAVVVGQSIANVDATNFIPAAVGLECYSVTSAEGVREDNGDITFTWMRRGRIGGEMMSGIDIPLSEESESYEIDIMDVGGAVRTISASAPTATYTAAQQAADFGSPLPLTVTATIYQLSAIAGRGYPTEVTV